MIFWTFSFHYLKRCCLNDPFLEWSSVTLRYNTNYNIRMVTLRDLYKATE